MDAGLPGHSGSGEHEDRLPPASAAKLSPKARQALAHPVRLQILLALIKSEAPRSATEIARSPSLQASVSVVSYHFDVLQSCGCVELEEKADEAPGPAGRYASNAIEI